MRSVDDCIAAHEARGGALSALRIGTADAIAEAMVARAVPLDLASFGVLHIVSTTADDPSLALLQGDLDLAITPFATHGAELVCEELGAVGAGVYASADHPLTARAGQLEDANLRDASVVALASRTSGAPSEARIVVTCEAPEIARVLAARADLLCVLPEIVKAVFAPELVRLASAGAPARMYAVRRKPVGAPKADRRLETLVGALRSTIQESP
jgi:DNA-binding transcriptional LysR family regulator